MMNNSYISPYCGACSIKDRIKVCCSKNPNTRISKIKKIDGKFYSVCPSLNKQGRCERYPTERCSTDTRPRICGQFECWKIVYGLDPRSTLEDLDKNGLMIKKDPSGGVKMAMRIDDIVLPRDY